ncbi:MAG: hypothetical protein JKY52_12425 [Flavobacteriales bacterium]|nr:hypothetical protein [Flavobacteriales bacterium]
MRVILLFIALLLAPFTPSSVALDDDTEEELIKRANKLFNKEQYVEAFPLYSSLLSNYPNNVDYNFKFSVCMLFADENKSNAIQYLEKVKANPNSDKRTYYYLGYAYHLNYRFKKAITAYNQFINNGSKKDVQKLQVQRRIEMCENGLTLMRNRAKLGVISKTVIKETEYFRTYDMKLLTGRIFVKPDEFKTPTDLAKDEESLVYLGKNAKMLFFSSYGQGENRDLYMVLKKADGWGTPQRLPDYINSPYDENFPIMHPNRNVLYFSSNGHNSMGGYDIFKARYDSVTNRWSKPVNLDFAINSADDDILYLPTADERTAFFSSKRSSVQGEISVYKIKLKEVPGRFGDEGAPEIASANASSEQMTIEEIQSEAQLDVNAKEEEVEASSTTASTAATPPSESIQAETLIGLDDEQLVDVGFEYAAKFKAEEERIQKEAEASFEIARTKKDQSTTKASEAAAIRSRLDNLSDSQQRETASQKADILENDAKKLSKQADLAFKIAKELTSEAEEKKQASLTAAATAEKVKTAVSEGKKDDAIPMLIDVKVMAQDMDNNPSGVSQRADDIELQAKLKEADAGEAREKAQFMETELTEIEDAITNLIEQADGIKDPAIKEELLSEAQELEAEKTDTKAELTRTYMQANKLDSQARSLRQAADFQEELTTEILSTSQGIELAATYNVSSDPSVEVATADDLPSPGEDNTTAAATAAVEPSLNLEDDPVSVQDPTASGNELNSGNSSESESTTQPSSEASTPEEIVASTDNPNTSLTIPADGALEENTPEESTSSANVPADNIPVDGTPEERTLAENNPEKNAPEESTSLANATEENTPQEGTAEGNIPEESTLAENISEEGTLAENTLEGNAPEESAPGETFDISPETLRDVIINEENVAEEILAVEKLTEEASDYEQEAQDIREKAASADPAFRENALKEAAKFEIAAEQKRSLAADGTSLLNIYAFRTTASQYDDITSESKYLTPEDKEAVRLKQTEATDKFEKAQELRETAETVEDPKAKAEILKEAEVLEVEAIASQEQINNELYFKENKGAIDEKKKSVGSMEYADIQSANRLYEESDNLYTIAKGSRSSAQTIEDPDEKKEAFRRADALERQALEKQQTAINIHDLHKYEEVLLTAVTNAGPISSDEEASLDKLTSEYTALQEETATIRTDAESLDDPEEVATALRRANDLETQALEKQREALTLYFESEQEVARILGEPTPSELATGTSLPDAETTTASAEPPGALGATNSATKEPDAESLALSANNNTENSSTTLPAAELPPNAATTSSNTDNREVNELIASSSAKREEARVLFESIETIDDPEQMLAALNEAERLELEADTEMAQAKRIDPGNETVLNDAAQSSGQLTATSPPGSESISSGTTSGTESATTSGTAPNVAEETKVSVSGIPLEEASAEEILAAIMSDDVTTTTVPGTTAASNGNEDEFYIDPSGNSDIQIVDNTDNTNNKATTSGTSETFVVEPTPTSVASPTQTVATLSAEEPLKADIFVVEERVSYTPSNPIPVNPVIPSGLLFKVQIGAFRKPIPQDLFKGINPIMGEKTAAGFIRYSAGLFRRLTSANTAKTVIRSMGYSDAFVVAFFNGKRISIADARKILADGTPPTGLASAGNKSGTSSARTNSKPAATTTTGTTDISTMDGLFYTVQVGVYSKPSNVGEKYKLNQLYTKRTSNGFIRYNHGKFNNFEDASNRKEVVINKGISDAFVTAYYKGKRISVTQARSIGGTPSSTSATGATPVSNTSRTNGATGVSNTNDSEDDNSHEDTDVTDEFDDVDNTKVVEDTKDSEDSIDDADNTPVTQDIETSDNTEQTDNSTSSSEVTDDNGTNSGTTTTVPADLPNIGGLYLINIGEFDQDVPVDQATIFMAIKELGINIFNVRGKAIYTVGEFRRYEDAEMLRGAVASRGIEDARIVVILNEDIISVEDYIKRALDNAND